MLQVAQNASRDAVIDRNGFRFTINISGDEMIAHLVIEQSDKEQVFSFSKADLKEIINSMGVVYGINESQLDKLIQAVSFDKQVEIARGKQPETGRDAGFELLFENAASKAPMLGDDGFIDYKNLDLISNATKGQPLAKKIPAGVGKPGMKVNGKEIPGRMGKDRSLPKGANTEVSPENANLLIAAKDGAITFSNNLVSIDGVYKINADVDMSTGNLDFVGSLKIKGTVKAGFRVKAAGNIEIGKNIEDAEIISGGSVAAAGGFVGSGKGIIKASEDVFVKYVENQVIEANHNINIGGGALNAHVTAGNAISLKGSKAIIVGGCTTAGNLIEADVLGSEFGTPTLIRVGLDMTLLNQLKKLEKEIKRLKEDGEKIQNAMYTLIRLELDNKLNPNQKEALKELKAQQVAIPGQLEALNLLHQELTSKLNENKKAKIVVRSKTYPGTVIQIGLLKQEIIKTIGACTFAANQDKIVIVSHT